MHLLDRYFLRELVAPLCYCLFGFLIFWLAFDLFGELDDLQKSELKFAAIVQLYIQKLPELLIVVIPIALLLAMLYTLGNLARHNELLAARAAGISMWRLSVGYIGVGVLFSGILFAVNEFWITHRDASNENWSGPLHIENHRENRSWDIANYNFTSREMIRPRITWRLNEAAIIKMVAEFGGYTNGIWTFKNLTAFHSDPQKPEAKMLQITNYPVLKIRELTLTPRQIRSECRIVELLNQARLAKEAQVSLREIADYRALHPDLPEAKKVKLDTQFHGRIAWAATCLIVVLLAIPFGAGGHRNAFVGVASSIGICFVYFILMRVGLALGTGGRLVPWLAAWLPNLLFGGGAIALIARMK